ncbi:cytosolic leucyl tRNA synthetase [Suhomyces tanzawaensis NRRL Y-17324]|uniref:leucine--tRNA ligase n=1 Tax=Suhomyces tanzawaensis NRRL Y-17324 TaxID=984487 RepID=A0A1E4SRT4_9ASCO|nr:cytosolic leucyl tRNA synthetase [Suhomyces tanzawaensis NRRL Y-17324]ODV82218.1 cytosolic leucyl tRNA synthetase [Suhomyces tanzawaensis NRRL Y-17324]
MSATIKLENTQRRDALIDIEKKYQKIWQEEKAFEIDPPTFEEEPIENGAELRAKHPKYFATMAYPYMNGVLHAGHSFTLSKVEFATGFERMNGKRALFPLGFHCTGMPIKAAADKIKREIEQFGEDFSGVPAEDEEEPEVKVAAKKEDVTKFTAKKSKAVAKQGRGKYQFEIMLQLGISKEEVVKFADSDYWLHYFPPLVQKDVTEFGGRVDWRRSMVTTDANLYYDAFVRWQINRLRDCGKIKFGERYTIYSEKDGQACLDHDRQSGEGVNPQEYVGIKILVKEFAPQAQELLKAANFDFANKKVYMVAATLRPETMYGQTCCFVSPKIDYGVFEAKNGEYYITTQRAFKNMSYQNLTPKRGYYEPVLEINGKSLIGSKIEAPLAVHKELRVLPMETVLASKGTGVVTCVPSDSPDDFVTTRDLANKSEYYQIEKEWVQTEIVPIVKTDKYGDKCAEFLVNDMKIQSPKDSVQLAAAKELAYKEGFYNGTLIIGKYAGEKVETAKPKVKDDLVASGQAFVYNEPEGVVISRSGDECIVSLEDQWYIDYGEETWKAQALECLGNMQTFAKETRNGFEGVLDWLKNWAVTRNFGLGTRLPWDQKYLVESLSDSTVYMAYYTIAHYLHSDYYGKVPGKFNIKPEQMTDEVFDYIFTRRDDVTSDIPTEQLKQLRREFEYFYPLDVRVSGKDLIPNHLTFFIYSHVALFPKQYWPQGIRANGHLMLNNAKMSKSTGNFLTLEQIVKKFGADASRIALADAGDTVEDANFDEANANAAILRLTTFKEWCEEIISTKDSLRTGSLDNFFDQAFENEMNDLIEQTYAHYEATNYKAALKTGLFDFQTARDYYRDSVSANVGMHRDLVLRYIETQALMLAPIAPHFAEYLYRELLGHQESVQNVKFPRANKEISKATSDALAYVRDLARSIREAEANVLKKKKGGKPSDVDVTKPAKLTMYVSKSFPEWQDNYIEIVRELYEAHSLDDNKVIKQKVGKDMKRAMPFISLLKQRLATEDAATVFNRKLTFSETDTLKAVKANIQRATYSIKVEDIEIIEFDNGSSDGVNVITGEAVKIGITGKIVDSAIPGDPGIMINNI